MAILCLLCSLRIQFTKHAIRSPYIFVRARYSGGVGRSLHQVGRPINTFLRWIVFKNVLNDTGGSGSYLSSKRLLFLEYLCTEREKQL